jgi:hypothetical protein
MRVGGQRREGDTDETRVEMPRLHKTLCDVKGNLILYRAVVFRFYQVKLFFK